MHPIHFWEPFEHKKVDAHKSRCNRRASPLFFNTSAQHPRLLICINRTYPAAKQSDNPHQQVLKIGSPAPASMWIFECRQVNPRMQMLSSKKRSDTHNQSFFARSFNENSKFPAWSLSYNHAQYKRNSYFRTESAIRSGGGAQTSATWPWCTDQVSAPRFLSGLHFARRWPDALVAPPPDTRKEMRRLEKAL